MGLRRLRQELRLEGIEKIDRRSDRRPVPPGYDEAATVQGYRQSRRAQLEGLDPKILENRLYAYLVRRRISADVIMDQLSRYVETNMIS